MLKQKIIWAKWNDPFGHLTNKENNSLEDDDLDYQSSRDSFLDEDEVRNSHNKDNQQGMTGPSIISPIGIFPINEFNLPSKIFNFWMGHTNFNISKNIAFKIEATPGVESLDVFSPYRFRIAIGKAFNQDEVKTGIEDNIVQKFTIKTASIKAKTSLEILKESLSKQGKYYCIFQMPNGKMNFSVGKTKEEAAEKGKQYTSLAQSIYKSWENAKITSTNS